MDLPEMRTDRAALVRLVDVHKSYHEGESEHVVLRGASAAIGRGEFAALLGPSGSGKSTLLNIISGIDAPSRGTVWIGGDCITTMNERERTLFRRSAIGFVFQAFNLIPTLTVEENLLLPRQLNGLSPGVDEVRRLLARVGLGDRGAAFPDRLSGGEQQRVAIARALAHEPMLVLADEPTGNLDDATGAEVMDLLEELTRAADRTLVVVTHAADVVSRADRVLRVRGGRLEEASEGQ